MADGTTESRAADRRRLENAGVLLPLQPGRPGTRSSARSRPRRTATRPAGQARLRRHRASIRRPSAPRTIPTWSDALYYAVECQDYAFYPDGRLTRTPGSTPGSRRAPRPGSTTSGWRRASTATCRASTGRTRRDTDDRPAPLPTSPYPVFVLTSTTDPATPIANGYADLLAARRRLVLPDARWPARDLSAGASPVRTTDDRGVPRRRHAAGRRGSRPATAASPTPTSPIAPPPRPAYDDALDLMQSIDDQILNTDDYLNRLDAEPHHRRLRLRRHRHLHADRQRDDDHPRGVRVHGDLPVTGTGTVDDDAGTFALDATDRRRPLRYERDGDGDTSVTGTYRGRRSTSRRRPDDRRRADGRGPRRDGRVARLETRGRITGSRAPSRSGSSPNPTAASSSRPTVRRRPGRGTCSPSRPAEVESAVADSRRRGASSTAPTTSAPSAS